MNQERQTAVADAHGWTGLDHAAGRGDLAEVRRLLAAGADPARTGPDGLTAYRIAVAAGHAETARVLCDAEDAAAPGRRAERQWRPYCRAYPASAVRAFPGWPDDAADEGDVVYVHDDLTVTRGFVPGEDVLLGAVTPAWERFCREQLGFTVPDDLSLMPGCPDD